ncbi:MAG: nickel pincer cofactor biosynthesis protein LarB [Candidatus Omnitrophica bacterium]|nr:nickel pincer cofactor biosynthesis protein LarB [Candidatus Omnitrophota bacterium]
MVKRRKRTRHSAVKAGGVVDDLCAGRLNKQEVLRYLERLPYEDVGFAKIDHHRCLRRGFPEVIYAEGKTLRQIEIISDAILKKGDPLFITRASEDIYRRLRRKHRSLKYNKPARAIYRLPKENRQKKRRGEILIITAGTSDIPVAEEAKVTLDMMGERVSVLYDVGVAGIHRLLKQRGVIRRAEVIIVVAGMEGALPSVVSGLVDRPIIAVPTSVGYGASFKGIAPLLTMLNSCSPGIAVMNIDNGFGAGYFASLINR